MNAWREILARTLGNFEGQDNVSPPWLVNPATKRRLKLDRYYPNAGIAVRFVGLTAKGQKRQSDWDLMEEEQRNQTRAELCKMNHVQLALIEPTDEAIKQIDRFLRTLVAAHRHLNELKRPNRYQREAARLLQQARLRTSELRSMVNRNPEQALANLAESWREREAGLLASLAAPAVGPYQEQIDQKDWAGRRRSSPIFLIYPVSTSRMR